MTWDDDDDLDAYYEDDCYYSGGDDDVPGDAYDDDCHYGGAEDEDQDPHVTEDCDAYAEDCPYNSDGGDDVHGDDCHYGGGDREQDPHVIEDCDAYGEDYQYNADGCGDDDDDNDNDAVYGYASDDDPNFCHGHYEETGDEPEYGYNDVDNSTMTTKNYTGPTTTKYELTSKSSNYDKQSESYIRGTTKDSYSSGDYSNRGRVGYKDEYKSSSTWRVGDKRGYTEYYKQEKMTRVEYDSRSLSGAGKSYKNYGGSGTKIYKP